MNGDDAGVSGVVDSFSSLGDPAQRLRDRWAGLAGKIAAIDEVHYQEVSAIGPRRGAA